MLHLVSDTCNQMTALQNRKHQQALCVHDANAAPAPYLCTCLELELYSKCRK